jgi:3-deoxy-manno-octulosonate cytidylyltransferase (CMP-KDO synthetase)
VSFGVVIPARYAASRLPGKPLLEIAGKPMIQHVYERAVESGAARVIVATDDERISGAVTTFGGEVCMTGASHLSGTDRIAEVVETLGFADEDIVVNLQGDEPMMPPELLRQVADNLRQHTAAPMATVCTAINEIDELFNPHVVKVVTDQSGMAIYFSRACIPWNRDAFERQPHRMPVSSRHFRHIGLYAYRAGFLREFVQWQPSPLELAESLEQLRAIWYGHKIHVAEAEVAPLPGVDTEEDLENVRKLFA